MLQPCSRAECPGVLSCGRASAALLRVSTDGLAGRGEALGARGTLPAYVKGRRVERGLSSGHWVRGVRRLGRLALGERREEVPDTRLGQDVAGPLGIGLDLMAKPADVQP